MQAFPGASNFLLINAEKSGLTAAQWAEHLRRYGILIRDCSNFATLSPYYFRIAVKNREASMDVKAGKGEWPVQPLYPDIAAGETIEKLQAREFPAKTGFT